MLKHCVISTINELAIFAKDAFYESPSDKFYINKTINVSEEVKLYLEQHDSRDGINRLYEIPGNSTLNNYMIIRLDYIRDKKSFYECDFTIQFIDKKSDLLELIKLENLIRKNTKGMTEIKKVEYVNNFICEYLTYDKTQKSWSAAMGAKYKVGTCTAYAGMFKVLIEAAGLKAGCIRSLTMKHRWNYVIIEDVKYYIDTTFNGAKLENRKKFFKNSPLFLDKAPDQEIIIPHKD